MQCSNLHAEAEDHTGPAEEDRMREQEPHRHADDTSLSPRLRGKTHKERLYTHNSIFFLCWQFYCAEWQEAMQSAIIRLWYILFFLSFPLWRRTLVLFRHSAFRLAAVSSDTVYCSQCSQPLQSEFLIRFAIFTRLIAIHNNTRGRHRHTHTSNCSNS